MARQLQHIDLAGPDLILKRALKLAADGKLPQAIYWACTIAHKNGGPAFFEANALAAALLLKAGEEESSLYYWDKIIRSAPHKLEWLEKAISVHLGRDNGEKSTKALQQWLEQLEQIYIEVPRTDFLAHLLANGIYCPGALGIHGGKIKGWLWLPQGEKINMTITGREKFTLALQPLSTHANHILYKIDEIIPESSRQWQLALNLKNGSHISGSPLICSSSKVVGSSSKSNSSELSILIPAYDDRKATLTTLGTLFASLKKNRIQPKIVVIWDQGPDRKLLASLAQLARRGKISLVVNETNLGFLGSVNNALAKINHGDVILLNADTIVHGDWIDRMYAAAQKEDTATVTALSNEAEIMSWPSVYDRGKVKTLAQTKILDNAARQLEPHEAVVEIPVGVGFCMLITRRALNRIGGLDGYHVCRGYGEESDFCLRAAQKGLKNYGAFNVFVAHLGERSFGVRKRALASQNNVAIFERFPDYQKSYEIAICDLAAKRNRRKISVNLLKTLSELPILEIRPWSQRILPPWIRDEKHKPNFTGAALFLRPGKDSRALLRIWTEIPVMELEFNLDEAMSELRSALANLQYREALILSSSAKFLRLCKDLGLAGGAEKKETKSLPEWDGTGATVVSAPPLTIGGFKRLMACAKKHRDKSFHVYHIKYIWADAPMPNNIFEIPPMENYAALRPSAFLMWDTYEDATAWKDWLTSHNCPDLEPLQLPEEI